MSLSKETSDKKVNFEFNKEFISVFSKKIKDNDTEFLNKTLKEQHPADSADIIENLSPEDRSKLIELEGFNLDPEIFTELNESIGVPPILCVGESGLIKEGFSFSNSLSSVNNESYSPSEIVGLS